MKKSLHFPLRVGTCAVSLGTSDFKSKTPQAPLPLYLGTLKTQGLYMSSLHHLDSGLHIRTHSSSIPNRLAKYFDLSIFFSGAVLWVTPLLYYCISITWPTLCMLPIFRHCRWSHKVSFIHPAKDPASHFSPLNTAIGTPSGVSVEH